MQSKKHCSICGHNIFTFGPGKRRAPSGELPRCARCGCLERHRAYRFALEALAPLFVNHPVLQFSNDVSAPREVFTNFTISEFEGDNHLDLAAIDRPDNSVGFLIANHVLEHVEDDHAALTEIDRVLTDDGALFLSVPDLLRVARTKEYGHARADKYGHWRLYGPDIVDRWRRAVPAWRGIGVVVRDPVTGAPDRATVLSRSETTIAAASARLAAAGLSPFDAFAPPQGGEAAA